MNICGSASFPTSVAVMTAPVTSSKVVIQNISMDDITITMASPMTTSFPSFSQSACDDERQMPCIYIIAIILYNIQQN